MKVTILVFPTNSTLDRGAWTSVPPFYVYLRISEVFADSVYDNNDMLLIVVLEETLQLLIDGGNISH